MAYVANGLLVVAAAILFRYADFVQLLGGTEFHLGWIVGVGMSGSIFMRLALGACIDRFGSRGLWLISTALFAATCFAHLFVTSHTGIAIYILRAAYCCTLAGSYGASMTFITNRSPANRLAELVGMLGTAGFLGNIVGTLLGDVLFGSVAVNHTQVMWMFLLAGLCGLLALPFAWIGSRGEKRPTPSPGPSMWQVLLQHYSGIVLCVAIAMGLGLGLPSTFLRTYAAELGIPRIGLFFAIYSVAALVTRVAARNSFGRLGTRPMIVFGLACLAVSQVMFLMVRAEWQLFVPAIGYGIAHAIVFPSVVAAGSMTFPPKNRGLATILVLAAWDFGQLVGAPLAGAVLRYSDAVGWPPYPTMYTSVFILLAVACLGYTFASKKERAKAPA